MARFVEYEDAMRGSRPDRARTVLEGIGFGSVSSVLGACAGTLSWLVFLDDGSEGNITRLGCALLVAAYALLIGTVAAHAWRHWSWVLSALGAVGCGVVVGFPAAFVLALMETPLYHGHWSFG